MEYPNFYQNLKEAQMRLRWTVVLYDDIPYQISAITNHKDDGIFRVYMRPIAKANTETYPGFLDSYPNDHPQLGVMFDQWLDENKNTSYIRKMMNSPSFKKFRPFPLGMINYRGRAIYLERQPTRKSEQGLTQSMVTENFLTLNTDQNVKTSGMGRSVDIFCQEMHDCILANHPSARAALEGMLNPDIENQSVAFARDFAFIRGPMGMIFFCYKADCIGMLPNNDFDRIKISKQFIHCKEVVEALRIFDTITFV